MQEYEVLSLDSRPAIRSGSYVSLLTHSLCCGTASFRTTATSARFFAFFPPCAASSGPYGQLPFRRRSVASVSRDGSDSGSGCRTLGPTVGVLVLLSLRRLLGFCRLRLR